MSLESTNGELIDSLYRERILRARATSPEQKLPAGAQLFEDICERMAAGLRDENPEADEATIQKRLRERLELLSRLRAGT